MRDYSFLGNGQFYIREFGSNAPLIEVGNCSAVNLAPQEDVKSLLNYTEPGGGTQNEVTRVTGVEFSYTFHDFSPDNLARALRAGSAAVTSGAVAGEEHAAYAGGFIQLDKIPDTDATITVVDVATGATTYTAGTDYEVRPGGLFILEGTTIPAPVAGAANIEVTYTAKASTKLQGLVTSDKQYEIVFIGLNEAQSGKVSRVHCFRVNHGVMTQLALIGQEHGAGEVSGKLMLDTTRSGAGVSKYFTYELED